MKCWICNMIISDCVLLPDPDNVNNLENNPCQDTFEYKEVSPFLFIYYYLCINCCDNYLKNYPQNIKKILNKEITGKF